MANAIRFKHIRGIPNSTAATKIANKSLQAIQEFAAHSKQADAVLDALRKGNATKETLSYALRNLGNADDKLTEARQSVVDFYYGITATISENIRGYSEETISNADDAKLLEIHEFTLKLYKMFPQAFPIPSGEKSA